MTSMDREGAARARAVAKYGFYKHLIVFISVNLLFLIINLIVTPDYLWSIWPFVGWGLAVVLHAFRVFVFSDRNRIVDRLTEQELRRTDGSADHPDRGERSR